MSSVAPGSNIPSPLPALSDIRRLETHVQLLLCIVWVLLAIHLMITDVWDETNGLAWLHNPQQSVAEKFTSVWTPPVAFFRPLPTLFAATVIHFAPTDAIAWRVLRAVNMAVLLGTLLLLQRIRQRWGDPLPTSINLRYWPYSNSLSLREKVKVNGPQVGIGDWGLGIITQGGQQLCRLFRQFAIRIRHSTILDSLILTFSRREKKPKHAASQVKNRYLPSSYAQFSSPLRNFLLTVLVLYSGSACIVAGWYTNCFDAWALFFLVAGIACLTVQRPWWAGILFAVALFCKETAVLIFPFLLLLYETQRVTIHEAVLALLPALIGALCYFTLRNMLIDFGSAGDIHAVQVTDVLPTLVNFGESFWRQTMKLSGPPISGFVWLGLSILTLCRWRARIGLVLFLIATVPVYLGMFAMAPQGKLIHHWNFIGRLYLIPGVLVLLFLMIEGRLWGIMLLLIPMLSGAWVTYRDHLRFQQTYQHIHALAASADERPLLIHTEDSLPNDPIREIRFGNFPQAQWELDCWRGTLRQRYSNHPSQLRGRALPP